MVPLSASCPKAVKIYDEAVDAYLSLRGDPSGLAASASAADSNFVAAHALAALLQLLSTAVGGGSPTVMSSRRLARAAVLRGGATRRDIALVLTVECIAAGRWRAASRVLNAQLIANPVDALALRIHHDISFFIGDSRTLRDSPARAWAAWEPRMPSFARVAGMLAFGLSETGADTRAEAVAMSALSADSGDAWSLHAAVHALTGAGRREDAMRLLRETEADWAVQGALFDRHLHWHSALLGIEDGSRGATAALSRFDEAIFGVEESPSSRDVHVHALGDATSLLWRLELLHGEGGKGGEAKPLPPPLYPRLSGARAPHVDVGRNGLTRWDALASRWTPYLPATAFHVPLEDGVPQGHMSRLCVWNDIHAVMALSMVAYGVIGPNSILAKKSLDALLAELDAVAIEAESQTRGGENGDAEFLLAATVALALPSPSANVLGPLGTGAAASPEQPAVIAAAGLATARGLAAFAARDYATAVELLYSVREKWSLLGGSGIQRSIFELTLLHAAARAGTSTLPLAVALASERIAQAPESPQAWYALSGVLMRRSLLGGVSASRDISHARMARERAHALGLNQGATY